MRFALMIGAIVSVVGPLTPCAQAQEFALLEHRYEQPAPAGDHGLWTSDQAPSRVLLHASYRETLYEPLIREAEVRYRLPPGLMQALVWAESRFNPMAISPAGAAGLAQLMPTTARELGVSNRHDPAQNIDGGARYLRQMLDRFGQIHLALAAYNAGPGAVTRAGGIPRNRETPGYVRSVLQRWMTYRPS
ncbi:lytic transglycosylase domain-containing protein [Croceibacterium salegens]|uniref:lytic transglycosylase domain-containing protein n=1 Tax=Croceibacterium salegens TaxID=1737568 RepID=UPI000A996B3E|nr:lytic transglycosylase domain-containing protein [Croceibacterium salegens]